MLPGIRVSTGTARHSKMAKPQPQPRRVLLRPEHPLCVTQLIPQGGSQGGLPAQGRKGPQWQGRQQARLRLPRPIWHPGSQAAAALHTPGQVPQVRARGPAGKKHNKMRPAGQSSSTTPEHCDYFSLPAGCRVSNSSSNTDRPTSQDGADGGGRWRAPPSQPKTKP